VSVQTSMRPVVLVAALAVLTGVGVAYGVGRHAPAAAVNAAPAPPAAVPLPQAAAASSGAPLDPVSPDEAMRFTDAWQQQPRVNLGIPAGTASVVIVKFNDWLCGGCKAMHEAYQPLLDRYAKEFPGAVKYVLKDWPWNSRCNFTISQSLGGHESSCEAAVAVRLARDRGKDAEMEAWLFSHQTSLIQMRLDPGTGAADAIKAEATSLLGLRPGDFDREFTARLPAIRQDVADGAAVHVEVTPTYYVNGIKTTAPVNPTDGSGGYNLPANYFDLGVRLELKKAGK